MRRWQQRKAFHAILNKQVWLSMATVHTVMVGGGGKQSGSNIRTCAMNGLKRLPRYCGKACTSTLTWRARRHPEISWCHQPKRRRCIIRKLLAAAVVIVSASSRDREEK